MSWAAASRRRATSIGLLLLLVGASVACLPAPPAAPAAVPVAIDASVPVAPTAVAAATDATVTVPDTVDASIRVTAGVPALAIGPGGQPPSALAVAVPAAGACHMRSGLPDRACTPGLANPEITPGTLSQTICNPAWSTKHIRPATAYTDRLKARLMAAYNLSGAAADFELDHLVALVDGGHPWDVRNLWPQPRTGEPNAGEKDIVENAVHKSICSGRIALDTARAQMALDWTKLRAAPSTTAVVDQEPTPEPEP